MGERAPIWNVNARANIYGLTLYHTKAHIFNALMEAVSYALRHCISSGAETGMKLDGELLMVGGATKSPLWKSILADVTQYPVKCVVGGGEAAYGDAFLAAVGVGAIKDFEKIKDWLSFEDPVVPSTGNKELYDKYFEKYLEIYEALKGTMNDFAKI